MLPTDSGFLVMHRHTTHHVSHGSVVQERILIHPKKKIKPLKVKVTYHT